MYQANATTCAIITAIIKEDRDNSNNNNNRDNNIRGIIGTRYP